jgi:hypothetical protein
MTAPTPNEKTAFGGSVAGSLNGRLVGSIGIAALQRTMSVYQGAARR